MTQTCTTEQTCVDCTKYADAFACMKKRAVSGMTPATDLEIQTAFDNKCEQILFPVSFKSCDKKFETRSLDFEKMVSIIDTRINTAVSTGIENYKKEIEEKEIIETEEGVVDTIRTYRVNDGTKSLLDNVAKEFGWKSIEGNGSSTYRVEIELVNDYQEPPVPKLQLLARAQGTKPLSIGDFDIPDTRPKQPIPYNIQVSKFQIRLDLTYALPAGEWIGIAYEVQGQIS